MQETCSLGFNDLMSVSCTGCLDIGPAINNGGGGAKNGKGWASQVLPLLPVPCISRFN